MSPFSEKGTATSGKSTATSPFGFAQGRLRLAALAQDDVSGGAGKAMADRSVGAGGRGVQRPTGEGVPRGSRNAQCVTGTPRLLTARL